MTTLTREAIEAASGRELDALVHAALFNSDEFVVIKRGLFWRPNDCGYTSNEAEAGIYSEAEARRRCHPEDEPVTMRRKTVPAYSTSGDAMLTVLEKMWERGVYVSMQPYRAGGWIADCDHEPEANSTYVKPISYSRGEGLPEAVCRAALLALLSQKAST